MNFEEFFGIDEKDISGRLAFIDKFEKELDAQNKTLGEEIQGINDFVKTKVCERFEGKEKTEKDTEALQEYADSIFEETRQRLEKRIQDISTLKQTIAKYRQILNSFLGIPITTTSRMAGPEGRTGKAGPTGKKGPDGSQKKQKKCFCC